MIDKKRKKVLVGTPMYGGKCYGVFTQSLLYLQHIMFSNGYFMDFTFITNESLITRARNEIVYTFMNSDFDYLLFIDSDHRFDPMGILKMIDEDEDIICGICPKKLINWKEVSEAAQLGAANLEFFTGDFVINTLDDAEIFPDKKFEIKHGGTGVMLIKKIVFEKLKSEMNVYQSDYGDHKVVEYFKTSVKDGQLLSEDYELCKDWRNIGGKVYAAPWVKITHIGTYEFVGSIHASFDLQKKKQELNIKK